MLSGIHPYSYLDLKNVKNKFEYICDWDKEFFWSIF